MSRLKASAIHLLCSLAIGSLLFAFLWLVWYPYPLFQAVGGLDVFLLLLAVDIVLGPTLTLIVYKREKKSLKYDIATIAVLQVLALVYGVHTLYAGRPVFVAALGHRFDLVQASDIDEDAILASSEGRLPHLGPRVVGTRTPEDKKIREAIMFGGTELGALPQFHVPVESMRVELLQRARSISDLKRWNEGEETSIDEWIEKRGMKPHEVVFQGLKARSKDMAVILDAKTAAVIGIAPFKPWD